MLQPMRNLMYLFVLTGLLFCIPHLLTAQIMTAPAIQWQKSFGGSGFEGINSIDQTADGGYILMGTASTNNGDVSGGHGLDDIWVVKTDAMGTLLWQRMLGGSSYEDGGSVISTSDGGCIIVGETRSNDGDVSNNYGAYDVWVVKLNSNGTIEWEKSLGGSGPDSGYGIRELADGGYVLLGITSSTNGMISDPKGSTDSWLVKLDDSGELVWEKTLGGSLSDALRSIANTSDGGFILAGNTSSTDGDVSGNHGGGDVWVVKVDSVGNIQWQNCFGGSLQDVAEVVAPAAGGGYFIGAYTNSFDGDVTNGRGGNDFWLIKTDDAGNLLWQRPAGTTNHEYARGMAVTSDGGAILAGGVGLADGDVSQVYGGIDAWLVRFSSTGDLLWEKNMGSTGDDALAAVIQTADGGFLVGGNAGAANRDVTEHFGSRDFWAVKLEAESALPVNFGSIQARYKAGHLVVDWETFSETNCLRYDIEASADGIHFKKIGSVNSRAVDGNSESPLQYNFSVEAAGLLSALSVVAFLMLGFKKRSGLVMGAWLLLFSGLLVVSCKKSAELNTLTDTITYIRIAQIDKNGTVHYSKTVKIGRD